MSLSFLLWAMGRFDRCALLHKGLGHQGHLVQQHPRQRHALDERIGRFIESAAQDQREDDPLTKSLKEEFGDGVL